MTYFNFRETHGSGTSYHKKLAKELEIFLSEQLKACGIEADVVICLIFIFITVCHVIKTIC